LEPHGVLLPIFFLREAADRTCRDGDGGTVIQVNNREMLARSAELKRLKVQHILAVTQVTDGEDQEGSLLAVDRFLEIVKDSVDRSNSGDLARMYRKTVTE
jgi:hypothetical protein